MTHKIDGTTPGTPVSGPTHVLPRTESPATPAAASDTLDLTATARLMQRLETVLAEVSVTDRARVDAVRQALASGAYEADPQRIADQLLSLEHDLLGRL